MPFEINRFHSCLLNPNEPPCENCIQMVTDRVCDLMKEQGYDEKNKDHYLVLLYFYITAMKDLATTLQEGIKADLADFANDENSYLN